MWAPPELKSEGDGEGVVSFPVFSSSSSWCLMDTTRACPACACGMRAVSETPASNGAQASKLVDLCLLMETNRDSYNLDEVRQRVVRAVRSDNIVEAPEAEEP